MTHLSKLSQGERDTYYREKELDAATPDDKADVLHRVQWLKYWYSLEGFKSLLDIGAKDGFCTRWLLKRHGFEDLVLVDPTVAAEEEFKLWLRKNLHTFNPMAKAVYAVNTIQEIRSGTKGAIHLEQGEFEAVWCSELIEHFPEDGCRDLIRHMDFYMSPEGRGFITTPHIDGPYGATNPDEEHITLFDEEKLSQMIKEETGYTPEIEVPEGILIEATWTKE